MDVSLTDTHCHIHEALRATKHTEDSVHKVWMRDGKGRDPDAMIKDARKVGVHKLICVGCTVEDSALAVEFVQSRPGTWASIGIHPHEASRYLHDQVAKDMFTALANHKKVVAVGECGLDYFYEHSSKADQEKMLRFQIELALEHHLPMIFHVREAFQDFWPIFDDYKGIRGVVHSFTATKKELKQVLARGLYVGLNGIMTFTKNPTQLEAAKAVPASRLLLETDAPFLTPVPDRGKICESKHVRLTAEFLAQLREEPLEELAHSSSQNATALFSLE
ncbi:MAG TPA: TatD family hydrolase [Candidatus Saccharimonadales bacterium]|nr:TatD family hydrolase [Candidatus Saccharimonadales bacterium]